MKTTFLHGELEEQIYMIQHDGFQCSDKKRLYFQVEEILVWAKGVSKAMVQMVLPVICLDLFIIEVCMIVVYIITKLMNVQ